MKKTISQKKIWVSTSGWRGYEQPINAVAGANDTGSWPDSPCPSKTATQELDAFKKMLRTEKIRFLELGGSTSNAFCVHRYILVPPQDQERARELARAHQKDTTLFYVVEKPEPQKQAI